MGGRATHVAEWVRWMLEQRQTLATLGQRDVMARLALSLVVHFGHESCKKAGRIRFEKEDEDQGDGEATTEADGVDVKIKDADSGDAKDGDDDDDDDDDDGSSSE